MSSLDITVVLLYIIMITVLSVWQGRKVKTLEDFSTGSRSYNGYFLFATLTATFIGGASTSGLTQKIFQYGPVYVMALWGGSLKQVLVAGFIVPRIKKFKDAKTIGDIMGMIYGKQVKLIAGLASVIVCIGVIGIQFTAFGYFFEVTTGIPYIYGIVLCALLVTTYSSFGGIRAIIANDVANCVVLFITLPLILFFAIKEIGGLGFFIKIAANHHVVDPLSPFAVLGLFLSFLLAETFLPPYVQRLLAGKSEKATFYSALFSGAASVPFFLIIGCLAVVACYMAPELDGQFAIPYI